MLEEHDDDNVERQIQQDLRRSIFQAQQSNRPILTHLNADTSWLLSIPYPESQSRPDGRTHYNILVDAWLDGPQVDVASWFSSQWHASPSSVKTVAQLQHLLQERETQSASRSGADGDANGDDKRSYIDLVVCSHEFTDHCHQATLEQVDSKVPVIATSRAAALIRSWHHFVTVIDMPILPPHVDWQSACVPPLPEWFGIARLVPSGWRDPLYFHSGVVFFINSNATLEHVESIIYTAHGVYPEYFHGLEAAQPAIQTLALIHGQDEFAVTAKGGGTIARLNLGAHNALKVQQHLKAKYWVGTHDESKEKAGLIAYTLQQKNISAADLLEQQQDNSRINDLKFGYLELGSGESVLLE